VIPQLTDAEEVLMQLKPAGQRLGQRVDP